MSKHTKGPWVIVRGDEWTTDIATVEGELPDGRPAHWNVASVNKQRDEWEHNRRLIAAAPDLLAIVTRELRNGEQSHFEDWLERTCPSGDVEAVERQWAGSADYALFADEYREELAVLDKIEGRS